MRREEARIPRLKCGVSSSYRIIALQETTQQKKHYKRAGVPKNQTHQLFEKTKLKKKGLWPNHRLFFFWLSS
jgi:hypothetical protein